MDIYKILYNLIEKPLAPKNYRELKNYYNSKGMFNEAEAMSHLLKSRFNEQDNNTFINQEQRENNQRNLGPN